MMQRERLGVRRLVWKCWVVLGVVGLVCMASPAMAGDSPAAKLALKMPQPFAKLPADMQKKLLHGKRVVTLFYRLNKKGKKVIVAQARGIIKRPPAQVYFHLSQVERVQEFMPNLIYSKIQKKLGPNTFLMLRIIKVLWTKIKMYLRVELVPKRRLIWRLVPHKDNGIADTVGAMTMEGIHGGKHTLVTYSVFTDTGRAVPGFIRKMLIRGSLPNVIKALEKRTMSDGRWKK